MNAPTPLARAARRKIAIARAAAREAAVRFWCKGYSIAGIIMEVEHAYKMAYTPCSIDKIIERARRADPTIPRAERGQERGGDLLDKRADLENPRPRVLSAGGPWDGDNAATVRV